MKDRPVKDFAWSNSKFIAAFTFQIVTLVVCIWLIITAVRFRLYRNRFGFANRQTRLTFIEVSCIVIWSFGRAFSCWFDYYGTWKKAVAEPPELWPAIMVYSYAIISYAAVLIALAILVLRVWLVFYQSNLAMATDENQWVSLITNYYLDLSKALSKFDSIIDRIVKQPLSNEIAKQTQSMDFSLRSSNNRSINNNNILISVSKSSIRNVLTSSVAPTSTNKIISREGSLALKHYNEPIQGRASRSGTVTDSSYYIPSLKLHNQNKHKYSQSAHSLTDVHIAKRASTLSSSKRKSLKSTSDVLRGVDEKDSNHEDDNEEDCGRDGPTHLHLGTMVLKVSEFAAAARAATEEDNDEVEENEEEDEDVTVPQMKPMPLEQLNSIPGDLPSDALGQSSAGDRPGFVDPFMIPASQDRHHQSATDTAGVMDGSPMRSESAVSVSAKSTKILDLVSESTSDVNGGQVRKKSTLQTVADEGAEDAQKRFSEKSTILKIPAVNENDDSSMVTQTLTLEIENNNDEDGGPTCEILTVDNWFYSNRLTWGNITWVTPRVLLTLIIPWMIQVFWHNKDIVVTLVNLLLLALIMLFCSRISCLYPPLSDALLIKHEFKLLALVLIVTATVYGALIIMAFLWLDISNDRFWFRYYRNIALFIMAVLITLVQTEWVIYQFTQTTDIDGHSNGISGGFRLTNQNINRAKARQSLGFFGSMTGLFSPRLLASPGHHHPSSVNHASHAFDESENELEKCTCYACIIMCLDTFPSFLCLGCCGLHSDYCQALWMPYKTRVNRETSSAIVLSSANQSASSRFSSLNPSAAKSRKLSLGSNSNGAESLDLAGGTRSSSSTNGHRSTLKNTRLIIANLLSGKTPNHSTIQHAQSQADIHRVKSTTSMGSPMRSPPNPDSPLSEAHALTLADPHRHALVSATSRQGVHSKLLLILAIEPSFRCFMKHLGLEFSSENLMFLIECNQWKKMKMQRMEEKERLKQEQLRQEAMAISRTHNVGGLSATASGLPRSTSDLIAKSESEIMIRDRGESKAQSDGALTISSALLKSGKDSVAASLLDFPLWVDSKVRSAIVFNESLNMDQKYLGLVGKYVLVTSEYSLNISHEIRNNVVNITRQLIEHLQDRERVARINSRSLLSTKTKSKSFMSFTNIFYGKYYSSTNVIRTGNTMMNSSFGPGSSSTKGGRSASQSHDPTPIVASGAGGGGGSSGSGIAAAAAVSSKDVSAVPLTAVAHKSSASTPTPIHVPLSGQPPTTAAAASSSEKKYTLDTSPMARIMNKGGPMLDTSLQFGEMIPLNVFDPVISSMLKLMRDSLQRFFQTDDYFLLTQEFPEYFAP